MNARQHPSESVLEADLDTILDRVAIPKEGDAVAVLTKRGEPIAGIYQGTIPARHDSTDWFQRNDRWIIQQDADNVAHVPTTWIRNAVVQKQTS